MIILIVDDDAEDIELFTEAVEQIDESINCVEAYNGLEALKVLKRNALLPNYIFLDINMPLMNGRKCLEEIKKNPNYQDIPVIIYSTTTDKKQIDECRRLGADFLTKPNSFDELINSLKRILKPAVTGLR
jgi:CheY-like chemotaxis protein